MADPVIEFRFILGPWRLEHFTGPLPEGKRLLALALLTAMQSRLLVTKGGS